MEGNAKPFNQKSHSKALRLFSFTALIKCLTALRLYGSTAGQTLVELLLALGIFAFIMTAVFALVFGGLTTGLRTEEQDYATMYAQEGLDAARSIRDRDWGSFVSAANGKTHGVEIDAINGGWKWKTPLDQNTSDETPFGARKFTREIFLEDVYRDANNNIFTGSNSANFDYSNSGDYQCEGSTCPSTNIEIDAIANATKLKTVRLDNLMAPKEYVVNTNIKALYHFNSSEGKELALGDLGGAGDADLIGLWHLNEAAAINASVVVSDVGSTSGILASDPVAINKTTTAGKFKNALTLDGTNDYVKIADSVGESIWTIMGPSSVARDAVFKEAFLFDGVDDYLNTPTPSNFNFSAQATVEGWVKTSTDSCGTLFSVSDTSSINNYQTIQIGNGCTGTLTNELVTVMRKVGGTSIYTIGYTTTNRSELINDQWHHVAVAFDGAAVKIYIDGSPKTITIGSGSNNGTYGAITNPTDASIGSWAFPTGSRTFYFKGSVDEFAIYNRALTGPASDKNCGDTSESGTDICIHYNSGIGKEVFNIESGIISLYHFNVNEAKELSTADSEVAAYGKGLWHFNDVPPASEEIGSWTYPGAGWQYRKAIDILGSTVIQSNYQVLIPVNTQSLISAGKMSPPGNDIRFSNAAGTPLDYWIESGMNTASTKIWVEIDSIAASPTITTIYMYYGNFGITAGSNGDNTFNFFDDFEDGVISDTKWPTKNVGTYIAETGGELKMTGVNAGTYYIQSPAFTAANIPMLVEARTKTLTVPTNGWSPVMWWQSATAGASMLEHNNTNKNHYTRNNATFTLIGAGKPLSEYHRNALILSSTAGWTAKASFETTTSANWSAAYANAFSGTYYIKIGPRHDNWVPPSTETMDGRIDFIYARKYASPEPVLIITNDSTTNNNAGYGYTNFGTAPTLTTAGKFSNALSFDGVDDYANVVDNGSTLDNMSNITVEAWINGNAFAGNYRTVIAKQLNYLLTVRSDGKLAGFVANGTSWSAEVIGTTVLSAASWNHIVMTYDGSASSIKLYVNGILDASGSFTGGIGNTSNALTIGDRPGISSQPFNGKIDEVAVYGTVLSSSIIQEHYLRGIARDDKSTYSAVTLEAWIKTGSNNNVIAGKENEYLMGISSTGKLQVAFNTNLCSKVNWSWLGGTAATVVNDNNWHHVAATFDKSISSNNVKLYINGQMIEQATQSITNVVPNCATSMGLGARENAGTWGSFFNGTLDEAVVYSVALSAAQIKEHYQRGITKDATINTQNSGIELSASDADVYSGTYGTNIKGLWHLNESSASNGSVIGAMVGNNGSLVTDNGAANKAIAGKFSNAISFDGVSDYMSVGDTTGSGLDITGAITVETWFRYDGKSNDWTFIAGKALNPCSDPWYLYAISMDNGVQGSQKFRFHISSGTAGSIKGGNSTTSAQVGTWYHLVGVYDSVAQKVFLYINGVKEMEAAANIVIGINNEPLTMGSNAICGGPAKGLIDETVVYNAALKADTIKEHYERGVYGDIRGPISTASNANLNQVLQFDGVDDYVSVADNDGFSPASKTVEAWVKFNALGSDDLIAGKGGEYWLAYNGLAGIGCPQTGKFSFMIYNGSTWTCITGTTTVDIGAWYHLVGTYDGTNMKLYINGTLEAGPTAAGVQPNSTNPFDVGSYSGAATAYALNGSIDEVAVWNKALTQADIWDHIGANLGYTANYYATVKRSMNFPTANYIDKFIEFVETAAIPTGTSIDYQISTDGCVTMKYWDGSKWVIANGWNDSSIVNRYFNQLGAVARTTLVDAIDDTQTNSLKLVSVAGFYPFGGKVIVDNEEIIYTGILANELIGVSRGAGATSHSSGAFISDIAPKLCFSARLHTTDISKTPILNKVEIKYSLNRDDAITWPIDIHTKKVISRVKWPSGLSFQDLELTEYLTDWMYPEFIDDTDADFTAAGSSCAGGMCGMEAGVLNGAVYAPSLIATPAYYRSAPKDAGAPSNFLKVKWSASVPSGAILKFLLNSADTEVGLMSSNWCGPTQCLSYPDYNIGYVLTDGNGEIVLNPANNNHQWFQYYIIIDEGTSDPATSPSLDKVTIQVKNLY